MTQDTWSQCLKKANTLPTPEMPSPALASIFADEHGKQPHVVYPGLATAGFKYCSVRFVNLSPDPAAPPQHVEDLSNEQIDELMRVQSDSGLATTSLGGRIGKVRFSGQKDNVLVKRGSAFVEIGFAEYLGYCKRCFEITQRLGAKLYRMFPFYAPEGQKNEDWSAAAIDSVGKVLSSMEEFDLLAGIETEANLIAADGHALASLAAKINHSRLGIVFDAGNMRTMGYRIDEILQQFAAVLPNLLWFHIKDYNGPVPETVGGHIEEDLLKHFVPCDIGHSGHPEIFQLLRRALPSLNQKMAALGLPGFFLELEPHVKGGGQFGGYSGPDGAGVALRALAALCQFTGIALQLRTFDDVLKDRARQAQRARK